MRIKAISKRQQVGEISGRARIKQVTALAAACERDLGNPALRFEPDGYPSSLALCIIDSIYSTGAHHSSVRKIVGR
jgi:hypothetical protein